MIIVLTAFHAALSLIPGPVLPRLEPCPGNPVSGVGIQVLVNPGNHAPVVVLEAVAVGVDLEQREVIPGAEDLLLIIVKQVGQAGERDGGGVGPAWAVPLTLMALLTIPGYQGCSSFDPESERRSSIEEIQAQLQTRTDALLRGGKAEPGKTPTLELEQCIRAALPHHSTSGW